LLAQFPFLFPEDKLSAWCESARFLGAVIRVFLPKKDYTKIVTSMLINQESDKSVFDFLEEHIADRPQVKRALATVMSVLVLMSPEHTFEFVNKHFVNHHEFIDLLSPQLRFLYIRALLDKQQGDADPKLIDMMFKLTCQYDPQNASAFLVNHIDFLNMDAAEREAKQFGCIACLITLKIRVQKYAEAVEQIGGEIERTLLNFTMSDLDVQPSSIDQLADLPALAEPMETIRVAIDLLQQLSRDQPNFAMLWQKVYLGFQLPVFVCAQKKPAVNAAVTLMFAYFLVTSLNSLTANHVFLILAVHFRMEPHQFREILANVFRRIDYQRNLYGAVEQLLMEDTIALVERVYADKARGFRSLQEPICGKCGQPISRTVGSAQLLPCGHCYHNWEECRIEGACPMCAGERQHGAVVHDDAPPRLTPDKYDQLMRRMNYRLRQSLGRDAGGVDASVYFGAADAPPPAARAIRLAPIAPPPRAFSVALSA
jgi:hypothetical protein